MARRTVGKGTLLDRSSTVTPKDEPPGDPSSEIGHTAADVAKMLDVSVSKIHACVRMGLVQPLRGRRREYRFTFSDLVILRSAVQAVVEVRGPARSVNRLAPLEGPFVRIDSPPKPDPTTPLTDRARKRLEIVQWVLAGHTIQDAAERFSYHRKTIASWIQLYRRGGAPALNEQAPQVVAESERKRKHSKFSPALRAKIREGRIQNPEWGKRPFTRWLAKQGYKLAPSSVEYLVREAEPRVRVRRGEVFLVAVRATGADSTVYSDVRVTGDFLDWSTDGISLEGFEDNGLPGWWVALELPPGEYRFRFILDGEVILLGDLLHHGVRGKSPLDEFTATIPPNAGYSEQPYLLTVAPHDPTGLPIPCRKIG